MSTRDGNPLNFRLLLPDKPNGPVLYRSANPDLADESAVHRMVEQLGIRTIVDLRNPKELQPFLGDNPSPLAKQFPLQSLSEVISPDRKPCELARVNINTTGIAYRVHMFHQFSWKPKLVVLYLLFKSLFTGDRTEVELYGAQELFNKGTQSDLYCSFIDYSTYAVTDVFRVLCNKNTFGILINCNAGKDRTGIISALIMDLLGYERKLIVEEYHKSEAMVTDIQADIDADFTSRGLDAETFARTPKRTMEEMLEHLHSKYGGAEAYLKQKGFSEDDLRTIKENLSAPPNC